MSPAAKRPYRKRKRAESEEETRQRITAAAVELHGSVGPAKTTVTEVAARAGVSRMTVYNHFPTDADLFVACSTHWATENPFPDPQEWLAIDDPEARLVEALTELYGWYDRKQAMLWNIIRDAPVVPALGKLMAGFWGDYMERIVSALTMGWPEGGESLSVKLLLVTDFHTWRTLNAAGLADREAAEVAAAMVVGAAGVRS